MNIYSVHYELEYGGLISYALFADVESAVRYIMDCQKINEPTISRVDITPFVRNYEEIASVTQAGGIVTFRPIASNGDCGVFYSISLKYLRGKITL